MQKTFLLTAVLATSLIASTSFAYTTQQADKGKEIFTNQCAMCHGARGGGGVVSDGSAYTGMKAPAVVGKGMLPNMKTVGNALAFVKGHMPLETPGSLSDADALDVIAFDLMANKIKADGQPLTAEIAQKIVLHGKK
jgi:cytochrome c